jgi:hypothetical protein
MTRYDKADQVEPGTRVRVSSQVGIPDAGSFGTVVKRSPNRHEWSQYRDRTRMTWVQIDGRLKPFGYYTNNLERVEEMSYVKNLVGPKPEPVQEPKHPTPWTSKGRDVLDANGSVIFRVQHRGAYNNDVSMSEAYDLARIVAEAVTAKFAQAKVQDSPSPF